MLSSHPIFITFQTFSFSITSHILRCPFPLPIHTRTHCLSIQVILKIPFTVLQINLHHSPNPTLYFSHSSHVPESSCQDLAISEDQKQLRYVCDLEPNNIYKNDDFEDHGVLSSPVITSQKYHWEADVSEKPAWILGAYGRKQHGYKMKFLFENKGNCQYVYWRYQPKYSYWIRGLKRICSV